MVERREDIERLDEDGKKLGGEQKEYIIVNGERVNEEGDEESRLTVILFLFEAHHLRGRRIIGLIPGLNFFFV